MKCFEETVSDIWLKHMYEQIKKLDEQNLNILIYFWVVSVHKVNSKFCYV